MANQSGKEKYLICLMYIYKNLSKKDLMRITWESLRTLERWLPKLEREWYIYSRNIWLWTWSSYEKRYHITDKTLENIVKESELSEEPIHINVIEWVPASINILSKETWKVTCLEYRPHSDHKFYLKDAPVVNKWSEARYIAYKSHNKRKDDEKKGIATMKVRQSFKPALEKKHIEMEKKSVVTFKWTYQ